MIPKIIHYCWLSDDPVPPKLQEYMKTWGEKLPGYKFKRWSFECFDIEYSIWVKEAFQNKKYAFAADFIRLYALYTEGGIYLDMDVEVRKDFEPFLSKKLMIAYENDRKDSIEAGVLGAEKGNKFIKACLDYYTDRHFIKTDGSFDTITLPKIIYKTLMEEKYDGEIYDSINFTAKSFSTGKIYANEETFSIHHFAGSWLTTHEQIWHSIENNVRVVLGKRVGEILLKYTPFRLVGMIYKWGVKETIKRIMNKLRKRY